MHLIRVLKLGQLFYWNVTRQICDMPFGLSHTELFDITVHVRACVYEGTHVASGYTSQQQVNKNSSKVLLSVFQSSSLCASLSLLSLSFLSFLNQIKLNKIFCCIAWRTCDAQQPFMFGAGINSNMCFSTLVAM